MKTNFKEFRIARNLRQQDVADAIGITRSAYAHYEKEARDPGLDMLIKLADFYHTSIDSLIGHKVHEAEISPPWMHPLLQKMSLISEEARGRIMHQLDYEVLIELNKQASERAQKKGDVAS